jgi:pyocin large subunit-like protein
MAARTLVLLCLLLTLAVPGLAGCAGATGVASPADTAQGAEAASDTASEAASDPELERIARSATWAPGQLQAHFSKHGREGPYPTAAAYDAGARETVRVGRPFSYVDRTSRARRRGFYDPPSNRFTSLTQDGKRITTHFRPDNRERYVRDLQGSTYR